MKTGSLSLSEFQHGKDVHIIIIIIIITITNLFTA